MAMFSHVVLGTNDLARARKFYDATLATLGYKGHGATETGAFYGTDAGPEFMITRPRDGKTACHANGGTVGFASPSRAAIHEFHKAALANGGTDEGAPGPRDFAPTAYAAYARDPDGNKICAFCYKAE